MSEERANYSVIPDEIPRDEKGRPLTTQPLTCVIGANGLPAWLPAQREGGEPLENGNAPDEHYATLPSPLRLNLGAGALPIAGYVNINVAYATARPKPEQVTICLSDPVYPLFKFYDNTADEVRASHVLEHFSHRDVATVLREWIRVLKPGGIIKLAVPDFRWVAEHYLRNEPQNYQGYVMGGHVDEHDVHHCVFDRLILTRLMRDMGLVDIESWASDQQDCASLPVSLNLMGRKAPAQVSAEAPASEDRTSFGVPLMNVLSAEHLDHCETISQARRMIEAGAIQVNGEIIRDPLIPMVATGPADAPAGITVGGKWSNWIPWRFAKRDDAPVPASAEAPASEGRLLKESNTQPASTPSGVLPSLRGKVYAVMTLPRLMFADTAFSVINGLGPLDVPLDRAHGVFWGQCLTQLLERHMGTGVPYILTLDYDTVFRPQDVVDLVAILDTHKEIDAVCPLQMRREGNQPLFVIRDRAGEVVHEMAREQLEAESVRVETGHFGLTLIRAASLNRVPLPWFHSVPSPDGRQSDEWIDEDIAFWRKWTAAGLQLHQANRVAIGHMQLMVTWPTRELKAQHQYISDYNAHGRPEGIWR